MDDSLASGPASEDKKLLKKRYERLYREVLAILARHDPMLIMGGDSAPWDEYSPEVGTILPRLKDASSPDDVRRIVHEEFMSWFSRDSAGPEQNYTEIANDTWAAWQAVARDPDP